MELGHLAFDDAGTGTKAAKPEDVLKDFSEHGLVAAPNATRGKTPRWALALRRMTWTAWVKDRRLGSILNP
jgi:hypothetical protein